MLLAGVWNTQQATLGFLSRKILEAGEGLFKNAVSEAASRDGGQKHSLPPGLRARRYCAQALAGQSVDGGESPGSL